MSGQKHVTPTAEDLAASVKSLDARGLPPVHLWNPPFQGDIDMRIARDGTWFYQGSPINRPQMVRLFSSILKRESERYFLVTPVEKVGIEVEDVPFIALDFEVEGEGSSQQLTFETHVGDRITAGADTPIRMEPTAGIDAPAPYVMVRAGMEARIDRKSFYRLVDLGEHADGWFGVWSGSRFFPLCRSADLEPLD